MKGRTHFPFTIDRLDKAGEIVEQLVGVEDYELAAATWLAAVKRWPKDRIMLRHRRAETCYNATTGR